MDLDGFCKRLGIDQPWEERGGGFWLESARLDPESMARWMADSGARLVTVTAQPVSTQVEYTELPPEVAVEVEQENREFKLSYHWDLRGTLITVSAITRGGSIPSMLSFCPVADWIGREIHDLYSISFSGRGDVSPLMLRTGDSSGIFVWDDAEGGA